MNSARLFFLCLRLAGVCLVVTASENYGLQIAGLVELFVYL